MRKLASSLLLIGFSSGSALSANNPRIFDDDFGRGGGGPRHMAGDAEFGAAAGLRAAVVEQTARINQLTTAVTDLRCTLITCLVGGCALFFVLLLSECFSPKASEFAHLCGRNFGAW